MEQGTARTWGEKPEQELSALQQVQLGNRCALHASAAAVQLLAGIRIDPQELGEELDALPFPLRLPFRLWRDGPVSPLQQVHLLRVLSRLRRLDLDADLVHPGPAQLAGTFLQPDRVALVTIGWSRFRPPCISCGRETASLAGRPLLTWHTMVVAAHDPRHTDRAGTVKPWGFINSWAGPERGLSWMPEKDFLRAWSLPTPLGGRRPVVLVRCRKFQER